MPLPKVSNLLVYYKYTTKMPIQAKTMPSFVQSIFEKYKDFEKKKGELHVSPFYGYRDTNYLQLTFDFDGGDAFKDGQRFCRMELVKEKENLNDWFVELTGRGLHVVNHNAYGPILRSQIEGIRKFLSQKLSRHYGSLDMSTSIRHLPIRRSLSLDSFGKTIVNPIRVTTFLSQSKIGLEQLQSKFELTEDKFKDILENYVLPKKIEYMDEAPFNLLRSLRKRKQEEEPVVKKKIKKTPNKVEEDQSDREP
jgi:hypothetical protein